MYPMALFANNYKYTCTFQYRKISLIFYFKERFVRNISTWTAKHPAIYHGHIHYLDFTRYVCFSLKHHIMTQQCVCFAAMKFKETLPTDDLFVCFAVDVFDSAGQNNEDLSLIVVMKFQLSTCYIESVIHHVYTPVTKWLLMLSFFCPTSFPQFFHSYFYLQIWVQKPIVYKYNQGPSGETDFLLLFPKIRGRLSPLPQASEC